MLPNDRNPTVYLRYYNSAGQPISPLLAELDRKRKRIFRLVEQSLIRHRRENMTTTFKQPASFSDLVSSELTQIRISQFIVHFIFVEGAEIAIESSFQHVGKDGRIVSQFEVYGTRKEITVHELLGQQIVAVEVESEESLRITFTSGESMRIVRNPNLHESCTIYVKGSTYIIT